MVKKKSILCVLLSLVMIVTMLPVVNVNAQSETRTVRLSILSDIHYYTDYPKDDADAVAFFDYLEASEMRMIRESDAILSEALSKVYEASPDAVLICGDVSSGGEYYNTVAFANKMTAARANLPEDTGIYVVPGNHDLNNSSGVYSNGTSFERAKRVTDEDFREIFEDFGYNSAYSFYEAESGPEVKNYGGLSYAVEIADGVTLIALDTVKYSNDTDVLFDKAHLVAGEISDDLLDWAVAEAKKAKAKGNLVLGMSHHGILPHYDVSNKLAASLSENYVISNWESVAATLADAGFAAFFTGHDHANDISKFVSPNGHTIYDIETSALCSYPCGIRTVDITIEKKSTETKYFFEINTDFIESIEGIDDFQTYAFDKCSFNVNNTGALAMNLLRPYLYEMTVYTSDEYGDGFEGYLRSKVKLPKEISVDSYFDEQLLVQLDGLIQEKLPFSTGFSMGKDYTLEINYKGRDDRVINLDVCISHEEEMEPSKPVSGSAISVSGSAISASGLDTSKIKIEETGVITIDLTKVPSSIEDLIDYITKALENEDNWTTDYNTTGIFGEISELINGAAKDIVNYKLDKENDESTLINYINKVYLGSRRGDEEYVSDDIRAEFDDLQDKILNDNDLKNEVVDRLFSYLADFMYQSSDYPELFTVLRTLKLAPEYMSFINISVDDASYNTLMLLSYLAMGLDNGESLLTRFLQLYGLGLKLPGSIMDKPMNELAGIVNVFTSDVNVPEDSQCCFFYYQQNPTQPTPAATPALTPPITPPVTPGQSTSNTPSVSEPDVITSKYTPAKPAQPELLEKDSTSIKVKTVNGQVYSIDGGKLWKLDGVFTGLEENTEYSIVTKVYATDLNYDSVISEALKVVTDRSETEDEQTGIIPGSKITAEEKVEAKLDVNSGFKANASKSKITVKWGEVEGAERYDIYAAYCKKGSKPEKIASVDGNTLSYTIKKLNGKPIDTEKNIKVYTVAYRKVGNKYKKIARSLEAHIAGYNNKTYSNVKKVTLNSGAEKLDISLAEGDTFQIEPKAVLKDSSKEMLHHVADFRYVSSNADVATVDENGLITAQGKGTCTIYVYAQNGYAAKVTVTV